MNSDSDSPKSPRLFVSKRDGWTKAEGQPLAARQREKEGEPDGAGRRKRGWERRENREDKRKEERRGGQRVRKGGKGAYWGMERGQRKGRREKTRRGSAMRVCKEEGSRSWRTHVMSGGFLPKNNKKKKMSHFCLSLESEHCSKTRPTNTVLLPARQSGCTPTATILNSQRSPTPQPGELASYSALVQSLQLLG